MASLAASKLLQKMYKFVTPDLADKLEIVWYQNYI